MGAPSSLAPLCLTSSPGSGMVGPSMPPTPMPSASTEHTLYTCASGAMWALCALIMSNPPVQDAVSRSRGAMEDLKVLLGCEAEEVQSASAWTLCNIAAGVPEVQRRLVEEHHVVEPLLELMRRGQPSSKGLAAWAVRSIVFEHPANQQRVYELGALRDLCSLLDLDTAPSTQASAVWAIGTLCAGQHEVQEAIRTLDGGSILGKVVSLLDSSVAQVQHQAANAVYNIAVRNGANQSQIAALGGLEKLTVLMHKSKGNPRSVEKVVAALLCLVLKHPDNQRRVGFNTAALTDICGLLGSPVPRVSGLAAGLVRVIVVDHGVLQLRLAALGALGHLVAMCVSGDTFAQEQAAAALFNLLTHQEGNVRLVHSLDGHKALAKLVVVGPSPGGPPKPAPAGGAAVTPSRLAQTCALMCLHSILEVMGDLAGELRELPGMLTTLCRMCDASFPCPKLRQHADRLLRKMAPEEYGSRARLAATTLLAALVPVAPEAPGACSGGGGGAGMGCGAADAARPVHSCCICVAEVDAEGSPAAAPKAGVFLPCFHYFHAECIQSWVERGRDSCPLCQNPVLANIQKLLVGGEGGGSGGASGAAGAGAGSH